VSWLFTAATLWRRWVAAAKDPEAAHDGLWREINGLMAQAPYWRERLGDGPIPPLSAFPITTFDDYREAIDRSYLTTTSELNGEPLVRWVLSSGSSGKQKRFPYTPTFHERYYDGANYPLPIVEFLARTRGAKGGALSLHAMTPTKASPAGIVEGYGSGFDQPEADLYPPEANAAPEPIRLWRPAYCLAADVRSIETVTCEPLVRMVQRFEEDRSFYLQLLRGERSLPEGYPALQVHPDRLAYVQKRFASPEPLSLVDVFPNLRLIHTWRSSVAGLQAEQYAAQFPQVHLLDNHYNASEAPISSPIHPDEVGGPIFADGMIHEFVEAGAALTADNVLKPWELQEGGLYEVLLTTSMGFVRYRLGDLVRCNGFFHRVPKIEFMRRATAEISLGVSTFGEDELARALSAATVPEGVRCVFAPSDDGRALTLYASSELPQTVLDQIHEAVAEGNQTYSATVEHSWSCHIRHAVVPATHPYWQQTRAAHDQGKPTILLHSPPTD
jgi:hypothetical protein